METMTTSSSLSRSRRPRRLGIDAHTEFVGVLVSELDAAVSSLLAAASRLTEEAPDGDGDLLDTPPIDRSVADVRRLLRLLDTIDGPGQDRHLELLSLADIFGQAAKSLDVEVAVRATAGSGAGHFLGDAESVRLGAELVLSAFAGGDGPVQLGISDDRLVVIEGPLDFSDERRVWQLRCGRRVLEREKCRVRLVRVPDGYRLEIRALEP